MATTITGPAPREVWTFGNLVEKRVRADGTAQLERRIPGPLGVIATLRHDGTSSVVVYTHGDGRANRFFTDDTGHVVQTTTYGSFGQVTSDTGAGAPLTYSDDLWNGGDDLRELGVVLLGPRAYDPDLGRFLQRDPLIHTGGGSDANPYSFAFDDPVNFADPSGLDGGPFDCFPCPDSTAPPPIYYGPGAGVGGTPSSTPAPVAVPATSGPGTPYGIVLRGVSPYKYDEIDYDTLADRARGADDLLERLDAIEQSALASGHEITYFTHPWVATGATAVVGGLDAVTFDGTRFARHQTPWAGAVDESGGAYGVGHTAGTVGMATWGVLRLAEPYMVSRLAAMTTAGRGTAVVATTGGTTTFFRGMTYGEALEVVETQGLSTERIVANQRLNPGAAGSGAYITSQEQTAIYYGDLAGHQGRGLGPAVVRIEVPTAQFQQFATRRAIAIETPIPRGPFAGATETLIPTEHIQEFNLMCSFFLHC